MAAAAVGFAITLGGLFETSVAAKVAVYGCVGRAGRPHQRRGSRAGGGRPVGLCRPRGGARGQGRAHALALAAEGADIVAADAPGPMVDLTYPLGTEDDLRDTAKQVEELGGRYP